MPETARSTQERILSAAMDEFLQRGFRSASLRSIVKTAGVTTGAFYGYYDSKGALFRALVHETYTHIMDTYRAALAFFENLPAAQQPDHMGTVGRDCMREMLFYMKDHRNESHLLLRCADGTPYAGMVDEIIELEVDSTDRYCAVLSSLGRPTPHIDPRLEHILVTGMMNAYFEMILHDMPLEDALRYLDELNAFYTAGWAKIMGQ